MEKKLGIWKKRLFVPLCTAFFFFLANAYRFFNAMYSHDSMMIYQNDDAHQFGIGRLLLPLYYTYIRGRVCNPWLICLFMLAFLMAAVVLTIRLLGIQKTPYKILTCAFLSANAVLTLSLATYIHYCDNYTLALFLSVLAVFFWQKERAWSLVLGALCIIAALCLYQSYIQVAVALMLLCLIKMLLQNGSVKKAILQGIKGVIMLAASCVAYFGIYRFALHLAGGSSHAYNYDTPNRVADLTDYSFFDLLRRLFQTWKYPLRYLLRYQTTFHRHLVAGGRQLFWGFCVCAVSFGSCTKTASGAHG